MYRTSVEFHFYPTRRQTTIVNLKSHNLERKQVTNGRFISTLTWIPTSRHVFPFQSRANLNQFPESTPHESVYSTYTLPPFPSSNSEQFPQFPIENFDLSSYDYTLPPPPSQLFSEETILNNLLVEQPPQIYRCEAFRAANYNNDARISTRLPLRCCMKSQAIQTNEISETSSIEQLLLENSLLNYGKLLNPKKNFYTNCETKGDCEEVAIIENSSPGEVSQPYKIFRLSPPNYNKRWLTQNSEVQVQADKVKSVDRATSPMDYKKVEELARFKSAERNLVSEGVKSVKTTVEPNNRCQILNFPKNASSECEHDDILVAAATPPSPILMCTVVKNGEIFDLKKIKCSGVPPRPVPRKSRQSSPREQTNLAYTTVITSESMEANNDIHRGQNVVMVDDLTPLPQGYASPTVPPQNYHSQHLPSCSICRDAAGDSIAGNNKQSFRRETVTNSHRGIDIAWGETVDSTHQGNPSHRELVSSVSSGHRPRRIHTSGDSSPTSCSQSYSTYTTYTSCCSGGISESLTPKEEAGISRGGILPTHSLMLSDNDMSGQSHSEHCLPKVNVVRATPERGSSPLCTALTSSPTQAPIGSRGGSLNLEDVFDHVSDEQQRQAIQEWLVNRVSANVAIHFGSKLSQMLQDSIHLGTSDELNEENKTPHDLEDVEAASLLNNEAGKSINPNIEKSGRRKRRSRDKGGRRRSCSLSSPGGRRSDSEVTLRRNERGGQKQTVSRKESPKSQKQIRMQTHLNDSKLLAPPAPNIQRSKHAFPPTSVLQSRAMPRIHIRPRQGASNLKNGRESDNMASRIIAHSRLKNEMERRCERGIYPFEHIFEIGPHDELVRSHQNVHDRRIKAVGMKTGCYLSVKGPIKKSPQTDAGNIRRDREVYELVIGAPSKEKADRCMNYLRDTFPKAVLTRKLIQSDFYQ